MDFKAFSIPTPTGYMIVSKESKQRCTFSSIFLIFSNIFVKIRIALETVIFGYVLVLILTSSQINSIINDTESPKSSTSATIPTQ